MSKDIVGFLFYRPDSGDISRSRGNAVPHDYDQSTDRPSIGVWSLMTTVAWLLCWGTLAEAVLQESMVETEERKFQRDREAIKALAGNYHVKFAFEETVSFQKGYGRTRRMATRSFA